MKSSAIFDSVENEKNLTTKSIWVGIVVLAWDLRFDSLRCQFRWANLASSKKEKNLTTLSKYEAMKRAIVILRH